MKNILPVLEAVYKFINVPFGVLERKIAQNHVSSSIVGNKKTRYFSTFRGPNFNYESWRQTMEKKVGRSSPHIHNLIEA